MELFSYFYETNANIINRLYRNFTR